MLLRAAIIFERLCAACESLRVRMHLWLRRTVSSFALKSADAARLQYCALLPQQMHWHGSLAASTQE